jgi:hypothetical protein
LKIKLAGYLELGEADPDYDATLDLEDDFDDGALADDESDPLGDESVGEFLDSLGDVAGVVGVVVPGEPVVGGVVLGDVGGVDGGFVGLVGLVVGFVVLGGVWPPPECVGGR